MNFSDIILIIISSAGFLHGVLLAVYLCFFKKKKTLANILLGLILVFMAFRVGKSVLLNFGNDLEPVFIFAGLAFILLIGPLLRWYVLAMIRPNFKLKSNHVIELIPFVGLFITSFFITKDWFDANNRDAVILFGSAIIFIYLHFAFYIFMTSRILQQQKRSYRGVELTKSQRTVLNWLHVLLIGFILIWISYFLNIIEDTIPYIVGPIMYSIVVYVLSYKAFRLKATEIDGSVFKIDDSQLIYNEIVNLIESKKLYLKSDVSLAMLGDLIGRNTQKTSAIINQFAKKNFNDFINEYRIEEAKILLTDSKNEHLKIAAIAFDVGFNTLSSFNVAFKKFEQTTPSSYRKNRFS